MRYCEECAAEVTETDYEAGFCTQCKRPLPAKETRTMKPKRWRKVRLSELQAVRNSLMEREINYAGCTSDELLRIYGAGNLKHVKGRGWYKLTAS